MAELFEGCDVPYTVDVLIDTLSVGEQIVDFVGQMNADMLVLGLRKRSMTGKVIFGSNAQYILMRASCRYLQ